MKRHNRVMGIGLALVLILVLAGAGRARAGSVGGFGGATEVTQLLNHTELIMQYEKQVQIELNQVTMIENQLHQYEEMLLNTATLPSQVAGIWQGAMGDLTALQQAVGQGQALAYTFSNIDQAFAQKFQGYTHFCNTNMTGANYQTQYSQWSQETNDTCRSALDSAHLQYQDFATEQGTTKALEQASQSATGRLQAIQAGNEIAGQMVDQMQKLRMLTMNQIDMQGQYMAQRQSEEDMSRGQREKFYQAPMLPTGGEPQWGVSDN